MIEEDTYRPAWTGDGIGIECGIAPAGLYFHLCVGDVGEAVCGLCIIDDIA